MNYGIPYQGSKSKIAKNVCAVFPLAENFYDLFGGGFSISHFMIKHRSKHYKYFHFNEIRPGVCGLINDAISGKYNYDVFKPEFITRERFFKEKEANPYIKLIWSFGNNGESYIFGEKIEKQKESIHNAIVFNKFDDFAKKYFGFEKFKDGYSVKDKRLLFNNKVKSIKKLNGKNKEQLQQLERLEQLQRLEQLEQLEKFNFYSLDYKKVPIRDSSVIYCDIPYRGTASYDKNKSFNHKEFYDWADSQDHPVYISEFSLPDTRFKCIWEKDKRSLMRGAKTKSRPKEKIFVNKVAYKMLLKEKGF